MSYAQYNLIEATDYNGLVGTNPTTTSGQLNAVWSTGGGSTGYGQTALATVTAGSAPGNIVSASSWANLVNTTSNSASHQGTSISSVTAPVAGDTIAYVAAIPSNLTTIYNSRLNAAGQGGTTPNTATSGSSWSSALTFTHTITFSSGDHARYFFNAGGQLAITCSHSNTTGSINQLWNGLASNIGTVVLSSTTSGSITIASTSYNGVTKISGGGSSPTINTNYGYYAYTTTPTSVFKQLASGAGTYVNSFIEVIVNSNGTQGANSDRGSVITIQTIWDEVPDGAAVADGSVTTVTIRPPATTYLTNTWGTPTITGVVTGS